MASCSSVPSYLRVVQGGVQRVPFLRDRRELLVGVVVVDLFEALSDLARATVVAPAEFQVGPLRASLHSWFVFRGRRLRFCAALYRPAVEPRA